MYSASLLPNCAGRLIRRHDRRRAHRVLFRRRQLRLPVPRRAGRYRRRMTRHRCRCRLLAPLTPPWLLPGAMIRRGIRHSVLRVFPTLIHESSNRRMSAPDLPASAIVCAAMPMCRKGSRSTCCRLPPLAKRCRQAGNGPGNYSRWSPGNSLPWHRWPSPTNPRHSIQPSRIRHAAHRRRRLTPSPSMPPSSSGWSMPMTSLRPPAGISWLWSGRREGRLSRLTCRAT